MTWSTGWAGKSTTLPVTLPTLLKLNDITQLSTVAWRRHLQNTSLSGVIPESLANIPLLEELFLENNNLSGEVPAALLQKTHLTFRLINLYTSCNLIAATPRQRKCPRDLDIVFVNGLQLASGPDAWAATWTNDDGVFWPRDWFPDDENLHGISMRVLSVSYNARLSEHKTGKLGHTANGHMSISQPLFHALVTRWKVGTVPFVLVGHCYEGLVIKSLVVYCQHNADDKHAKSFMRNLRGVVSYGVPHQGSKLAYSLETFNQENQQLSEQFRVAIQNRDREHGLPRVKFFAFAEELPTDGVMLVPEVSAKGDHRGVNEFLLLQQTDHYSMCKPNSRVAEAYYMFVNFLVTKIIAADPELQKATRPRGSAP